MAYGSDVTVHQLESLTTLPEYIEGVGFSHVHHVGNLLAGSPMDALNQSRQVYREWRLLLLVFRLDQQPFQLFNVLGQGIVVNADQILRRCQQLVKPFGHVWEQAFLTVEIALADRVYRSS